MHPIRIAFVQFPWPGRCETMMDTYRQWMHAEAEQVCLLELSISPELPSEIDNSGFGWAEARHNHEAFPK
jgi:hypothetical protein